MNDYLKYTISPTAQYACLYNISSELGASAGKLVTIAGFGLFGNVKNISYISNKKEMKETKYPNYFVNKQGEVFSTKYNKVNKLKPGRTRGGYLQVWVYSNCIKKGILVHRLVAETFIPNLENKPEINHKNSIRNDNRLENLEWSTPKENINHAILNGLHNNRGENHYRARLSKEQVLQIRELYSTKKYTQKQLGKMFDVGSKNICSIINKKTWKE